MNLVAVLVRLGHLAALTEQVTIGRCRVDLATLATRRMNTRIERRTRTQYRFHSEAAASEGSGEQVFAFEQATQGIGRGHLGAVEQRQAFFGGQGQRREAGDFQCLGGFQPFALVTRLAFAKQYQGHVRQRRQVTGSTH